MKSEIIKTVTCILFAIILLSFVFCSSGTKNVKFVSCDENYTLVLGMQKELQELSYVEVYNLYLQNNSNNEKKLITGENAVLPRVKRYLDMIKVRDFKPGKAKSIFDYHFVDPAVFTENEFNSICNCYEKNKARFPEINGRIGAFVYGHHRLFREVFSLSDGFFIVTEFDGKLSIVTDPSFENMTQIPEKRHFNSVGYFDNSNNLHIRKGKIVSGVMTGFYGKPVKQVLFVTEDGSVDYTGEVELLWADILYSPGKTGVNLDYILQAKNSKGEKLGDVFIYKEFSFR